MFYYDSVRPEKLSGAQLDYVLALGWYRMHQSLFTTSHIEMNDLHRVHWLRYSIDYITSRPSHRRLLKRNGKFTFTIEPLTAIRTDHKILHQKYRASIDFDGAESIADCLFGSSDSEQSIFNTFCISVFDQNTLIAGSYFDVGEKSAASILNFFDPMYSRYSLGKYLILLTIEYLRQQGYLYYYPGYIVQALPKMNYKLFLGKEHAFYFEPETGTWKPFEEHILLKPSSPEEIQNPVTLFQHRSVEP